MQGGLEEIPDSFMRLIEGMLGANVEERMTTEQVMQSEWF